MIVNLMRYSVRVYDRNRKLHLFPTFKINVQKMLLNFTLERVCELETSTNKDFYVIAYRGLYPKEELFIELDDVLFPLKRHNDREMPGLPQIGLFASLEDAEPLFSFEDIQEFYNTFPDVTHAIIDESYGKALYNQDRHLYQSPIELLTLGKQVKNQDDHLIGYEGFVI